VDEANEHAEALPFANAAFDVMAVAASAGGQDSGSQALSGLPAHFPAAILVVQPLDPGIAA